MPKDTPPVLRVIFDTQDNVVHFPVDTSWKEPRQMEGIDEFAAYLNTKAASQQRFVVINAAPLVVRGRGGLGRLYAKFIKGEPQLRTRIVAGALPDDAFTLTRVRGAWAVPHAMRPSKRLRCKRMCHSTMHGKRYGTTSNSGWAT